MFGFLFGNSESFEEFKKRRDKEDLQERLDSLQKEFNESEDSYQMVKPDYELAKKKLLDAKRDLYKLELEPKEDGKPLRELQKKLIDLEPEYQKLKKLLHSKGMAQTELSMKISILRNHLSRNDRTIRPFPPHLLS